MTRFYLTPKSEERFRAVTNKTLHISHVRHKCTCGKQTTAKALTQYGHCLSCQKAAAKAPINFVFTTGHMNYLAPENGDCRFWAVPSTWSKAGKV